MTTTACATCNCPSDLVRRVEVRPIRPDERGAWDALVAAPHYLGLRSLFGKTLRYVATVEGHWLALLGWQAAALKCAARDDWIGWPRVLHYQRLHLVANNARFLILPSTRCSSMHTPIHIRWWSISARSTRSTSRASRSGTQHD